MSGNNTKKILKKHAYPYFKLYLSVGESLFCLCVYVCVYMCVSMCMCVYVFVFV